MAGRKEEVRIAGVEARKGQDGQAGGVLGVVQRGLGELAMGRGLERQAGGGPGSGETSWRDAMRGTGELARGIGKARQAELAVGVVEERQAGD